MRMDMTKQTFSYSRPRECDIASHSRDGLACDLMEEKPFAGISFLLLDFKLTTSVPIMFITSSLLVEEVICPS